MNIDAALFRKRRRDGARSFRLSPRLAFLALFVVTSVSAQMDDHGNSITESQLVNDADVSRKDQVTEYPHADTRPDDRSATTVDRDRFGRAREVRVYDRRRRVRRIIKIVREANTTTTTTTDNFADGTPERITTTTWKESYPGGPKEPTASETVIYDPVTHRPKERWHDEMPGGRLWHDDWQPGWPDGTWIRRPQPSVNPRISSGEVKIEITGTGETIGHIADLRLTNLTKNSLKLTIPPMILESVSGKTQDYAVPGGQEVALDPGKPKTVPVDGVCLVRNKPPVGKGITGDLVINDGGSDSPGSAVKIPANNAQTMLRTATAIYQAAKQLEKDGALKEIPYSDPKKKQDIVVQWSTWMNPEISKLTGVPPATKQDLEKVVYKQVEQGGPVTAAKKKKIDEGINAIFEAIELTSEKAKDLEKTGTPAETSSPRAEASPITETTPAPVQP